MANPLEAWKQHATASEHMDLMGVGSHQKKGWNFAQNFPALVPGGGVTATQWVGPTLATGYQLGQEGLRSLLPEKWGGTNIGFVDAMKKGWTEAKQNVQGMRGKGFDKDDYNEWMHAQGYAPDYDFSGIKGQTAGLGVASFLKAKFGPKVGAYLFKKGKLKTQQEMGNRLGPIIKKKISGGGGGNKIITKKKKISAPPGEKGGPGYISPKKKYTPPARPHSGGSGNTGQATGKSSGKNYGPYSKADGGLINFYKYGGFIG